MLYIKIKLSLSKNIPRVFFIAADETHFKHIITSILIIFMYLFHTETDFLFIVIFPVQEVSLQRNDSLILKLLAYLFQFLSIFGITFPLFHFKNRTAFFNRLPHTSFISLPFNHIIILDSLFIVRLNSFLQHIIYFFHFNKLFFFCSTITSSPSTHFLILKILPPVSFILSILFCI